MSLHSIHCIGHDFLHLPTALPGIVFCFFGATLARSCNCVYALDALAFSHFVISARQRGNIVPPAGKVNMSKAGRKLNVRADKYKVNREGDALHKSSSRIYDTLEPR